MEEVRSAENDYDDFVSGKLSEVHRFIDNVVGFFHNIPWKEPWMIALMSFHIMFLLIVMRYRRDIKSQLWLCVVAFFLVFFSKEIWILFTSFGAHKNFMNRSSMETYWTIPIMMIWALLEASNSFINFNFNLPL
ncbi:hypothetical protein ZOSMA_78G00880 [Zostera marina]|uniref:Uncharacterized protein n=1 Tax=Zostera marina TaxID=29655 RepID=A0A0K9NQF9_ZOSMR|nr:hypothetical protein ZOSMA_78G00880 [Zostera marina]